MADAENLAERVARRVRAIRIAKKLTQGEVAARCRMTANNVGRIELGAENLTLSTLERLAKALDVDVVEFFREPRRKK